MSNKYIKQSDDHDEEHQPLVGQKSSKDTTKSATAGVGGGLYENKSYGAKLWGRTTLLGLLSFLVAYAACGGVLLLMLWASVGLALILPFIIQYLPALLCGKCYRKTGKGEWHSVVKSVVFWSALLGSFSAVAGGYFGREWYYANSLTQYTQVNPADAPKSDLGTTIGFAGAKANNQAGGRVLASGFWPVCVAPISFFPAVKTVSYYAVDTGRCCTDIPMSCSSWGVVTGGIRLKPKFMEMYPSASSAVDNAKQLFELQDNGNVVFIKMGDAAADMDNLKFRFIIISACAFAGAFAFSLIRSCYGQY